MTLYSRSGARAVSRKPVKKSVAAIVRYVTAPDGSHHVIAQGETRFRIKEYLQVEPYLLARIERIEEEDAEHDPEIEARFLNLKAQAHQALALLPQKPEDLDQAIDLVFRARNLDDERIGGYVNHASTEDVDELHDVRARLAGERAPGDPPRKQGWR